MGEGIEREKLYVKKGGQTFLKGQTLKNSGMVPTWSRQQLLNYTM